MKILTTPCLRIRSFRRETGKGYKELTEETPRRTFGRNELMSEMITENPGSGPSCQRTRTHSMLFGTVAPIPFHGAGLGGFWSLPDIQWRSPSQPHIQWEGNSHREFCLEECQPSDGLPGPSRWLAEPDFPRPIRRHDRHDGSPCDYDQNTF